MPARVAELISEGSCLQEINTTIKIQLKVKGELKKLKLTTMTRDYR